MWGPFVAAVLVCCGAKQLAKTCQYRERRLIRTTNIKPVSIFFSVMYRLEAPTVPAGNSYVTTDRINI